MKKILYMIMMLALVGSAFGFQRIDVPLGGEVEELFTGNDLAFLEDGTYVDNEDDCQFCQENNEDYIQLLQIGSVPLGSPVVNYFQDDFDAPEGRDYLFIDDSGATSMYQYTLRFDSFVEYEDNEFDFVSNIIEIQGRIYTITSVDFTAEGVLDEISLTSGETIIWFSVGDVIERRINGVTHTIELVDVGLNRDRCGVRVDGSLVWINLGSIETINGVSIAVTDISSIQNNDAVCQLSIGADEILLKNGQEVEIEGVEIEDSFVEFILPNSPVGDGNGLWEGFVIEFTPEDEIYLAEGDQYIDPVFKNFVIAYEGATRVDPKEIAFEAVGDIGEVTFENRDGRQVALDFTLIGNSVQLADGDDPDDRIYLEGESCVGNGDILNCEGARFVLIHNENIRVIELKEFDLASGEIGFEDLTTGIIREDELGITQPDGSIQYRVTDGVFFSLTYREADGLPGAPALAERIEFSNVWDTPIFTAGHMDSQFISQENEIIITFMEPGGNQRTSFDVRVVENTEDDELSFIVAQLRVIAMVSADESFNSDIVGVGRSSIIEFNPDREIGNTVSITSYAEDVIGSVVVGETGLSFPVCRLRGDMNGDGVVDLTDPVAMLNYLFQGGARPPCDLDWNGDGNEDITDPINLLSFLFGGA